MREQDLPLTQAPDLLELRLAEVFNSNEKSSLLKIIERLPYPFNIVNLKSAAKEKQTPNPGKVFFLTIEEYNLLEKKIPKWKDSWFILLVDEVKDEEYLDVDNLLVLDNATQNQVPSLLETINQHFCHYKKKQLVKNAIKNAQVLGKESVKFLEGLSDSANRGEKELVISGKTGIEIIEELLSFYGEYFVISDENDLEKLLKKSVNKSKIVKSVQIYDSLDELLDEDKGGGMILPLVNGESLSLALYRFPKNISSIAPLYTYFLHSLNSVGYSKLHPASEGEEDAIWEEAFSKFPFPCALVTEQGELILHNPSFSKLNLSPAALSRKENLEKVEVDNRVFELNRIEISRSERKQSLLMLISENSSIENQSGNKKEDSSEELGIVSSSIAHELNNPLAGILATIAVLELEDEWLDDPEVSQALVEMKQSGKRCKDLIEIFLGFSRAQPKRGESHDIEEVFSKSLELIRFRTIESNARFNFNLQKKTGTFKREFNDSILSMMFYLILNEILTSFSHHKLVSRDEDNVLVGSLSEGATKIIIEMEKDFNFYKSIEESKLIQHLLDLLGMSLQVEQRRIILSEWTLT